MLVDAPIYIVDQPWQHQIDIAYRKRIFLLSSATYAFFESFDDISLFLEVFSELLLLLQDVEEYQTIRNNQELEYA